MTPKNEKKTELACVVAAGLIAASPRHYGNTDLSDSETTRKQLAREALAVVDEIFAVAETLEGEATDPRALPRWRDPESAIPGLGWTPCRVYGPLPIDENPQEEGDQGDP